MDFFSLMFQGPQPNNEQEERDLVAYVNWHKSKMECVAMDKLPEDLVEDLFGFEAPSEEQLKSISIWATKALELQSEIDNIQEYLKKIQHELAEIEERELPQALLQANMLEFRLVGGGKIAVRDVIQGGLHKDQEKREFTMQWVVDEGGQEIIKDHFEIDYTKGSYDEAVALRKLLADNKIHFDEFESIHGMTLQAFLREKLRQGTVPPFDKMGIRYFKKAEIKLPKKGQ